jgi:hypothetical protein
MVVYIGGIGVLLKVLSRWHKWNIWFLHLIFFISLWWYGQCFLISNFKDENFQITPFQIFVAYFNFFHSPLVVWSNFFKFQNRFFQFFHFPMVVWPIFFKIQKLKFSIQISETKFFHFKISLWHKQFFVSPMLPNLLKDCKNYLPKIVIFRIPPTSSP